MALVFIDPPGAGYSQAIAPHTNSDFWGVDQDPPVIRDFIRRYVNVNNRQLSPKYVYGESYGGIRTPIVANLMEDAGKSQFEPDKSGKDSVVLSGVILNSPVLAYDVTCSDYGDDWKKPLSCAGLVPTYAMIADWHKLSKARPAGTSVESYLSTIRKFMVERFAPANELYYKGVPNEDTEYFDSPEWSAFVDTPDGDILTSYLSAITTIKEGNWRHGLNNGEVFFMDTVLLKNFIKNYYDARMVIPGKWVKRVGDVPAHEEPYNMSDYEDVAFQNEIKTYLPNFTNYNVSSTYIKSSDAAYDGWKWERTATASKQATSLPDLKAIVVKDPSIKTLVFHGYYDIVTPFYQTELDIEGAGLKDRMPVGLFEGGHMTYSSEEARRPLKEMLNAFYDAPPYAGPRTSAVKALSTQ
ncbi:Serine carboxypeptidase [Phyllobacterium sp. CL33Tsu]|uniref:hypothetical protein n=1 Tax=Phyllobacterium sp. CL33Tsu TaxID=1798191 RepID=UPI0008DF058C|nr:hypothetical protein [Phyllobacterium sp. CL33Tsu]SFJ37106.1 Serine carboxypeptidase [Phyllobacterium sp. CL33Tsu]